MSVSATVFVTFIFIGALASLGFSILTVMAEAMRPVPSDGEFLLYWVISSAMVAIVGGVALLGWGA